jgi:hypothetical protein
MITRTVRWAILISKPIRALHRQKTLSQSFRNIASKI